MSPVCNVDCNVERLNEAKCRDFPGSGHHLHRFANPGRAEVACRKRSSGWARRVARRLRIEYARRGPPKAPKPASRLPDFRVAP